MSATFTPSPRYAGLMIVLALVLGGGTAQGLWTDHLIELAMIPALFLGLANLRGSRLDGAAQLLVLLVIGVLFLQFLPVWRSIPLLEESAMGFWSPAPQKALEASLFTFATLGFFLYVSGMGDRERERCIPYFYIGLFINAAIAIVQLSYGRSATIAGILPFAMTTGLFANENHFSSLFFAMIPLLAYSLIVRRESVLMFLCVSILLVGILFAVGSRAGMGISTAIAVISLLWFMPVRNRKLARLLATVVGVLMVIATIVLFGSGSSIESDARWIMFSTTSKAIAGHWLFGSGLGTFTFVYPTYETLENVVRTFANHAHNDYLEIILELGLAGIVLIAAYVVLVARGLFRSEQSETAFLALLALGLHSLVDYPLRTLALATTFAFFSALILTRAEAQPKTRAPKRSSRRRRSRSMVIEHTPVPEAG